MDSSLSAEIRRKVAREAAFLLYFRIEKEYKQAKLKAAETLGVNFLPTNLEVAAELDKIAEEMEGPKRSKRLVQMRRQALKIMKILKKHSPTLVGSVWRGTVHRDSDIDINVYHNQPEEILETLEKENFKIMEKGWVTITQTGMWHKRYRIVLELPANIKVEIIVRNSAEQSAKEKCEIYGDTISGLNIQELEKTLSKNPAQRFVPF
ncbi:MAG: nucleotidyltransferase domain-containing protein [Candidatus Bathyarchaeia archaeon]